MKDQRFWTKLGPTIWLVGAVVVALALSVMNYVGIIETQHRAELFQAHQRLAREQRAYARMAHYRDQQAEYTSLIQDITRTVVRNDRAYGLGGVREDTVLYSNKSILNAILSDLHNRNPQQWRAHVGQFYEDRYEVVTSVPNIWPVREDQFDRVTSGFGLRRSPMDSRVHIHEGIDITTRRHRGAVIATADGEVYGLWRNHPRFGRIVYLRHDNGFTTRYAHLSRVVVEYQSQVERGDVIGYTGNSGLSDGEHLHYEIRKNNQPVDPVKFMLIRR